MNGSRDLFPDGLGLSIVKRLIDMHEGTTSVKSELEKGMTFTILLPISSRVL
ncbi:ATP-binding protein [Peribacillus simplex]|uniref:histidine kinase n=2 Tax=Peribacillus TaxID=2675229 RepID=A0AA90T555_9BACI|nr:MULTISPECIES: ATP-binding protein [Peribacillus]MDP1421770.1 ATP-binding protein [Peribacillus simplex]MDP1454453.1 ATP-binding protein [Peribacillus frigoritolerans]